MNRLVDVHLSHVDLDELRQISGQTADLDLVHVVHDLAAALRECLQDAESRRALGREAALAALPFERARAIRVYAEGVQALAR